MSISLIICSRGRPESLARTLDGVAWLRHSDFELIVVVDPGDPETARCIARHAPGARVGACPAANLAMARNAGLAMARGDIVAFLDDDAVPVPDWLDRLAAAYRDPDVAAAGGFIRARDGVKFQYRVVLIDEFGGDHRVRRPPLRVPQGWFLSLTGTNFSVRRKAALAIGGFDETYAYFLEETDFLRRLTGQGGRIAVVQDAEVYHFHAASAVRDENGVPASLEVIARSKAYYCGINNPGAMQAAVTRALQEFSKQKTARVNAHRRAGRVTAAEQSVLLSGLARGLREGAALVEAGRRLAAFAPDPGGFVRYDPAKGQPRRRLCVLTDKTRPGQDFAAIRDLAGAAVEMTVIGLSRRLRSRIRFEAGCWLHDLSFIRLVFHGGTARLALAQLRLVSARRGFDMIHVAAQNAALERVAKASGLPSLPQPGAFKPVMSPAIA
jgi:glycogen(starch) synthase